jgi:2-dehydropantoate 2-reductase
MRIAILGSGAVGGYFGARLARAGNDVTFVARGAHLDAMREGGLQIRSPLGDFTVRAAAEQDTTRVGPVDLVLFAVKTYDSATALPLLPPLLGPDTVVLTLQNGVESADEVAAVAQRERVLGGTTYIATALTAPGLVTQTGTHRRIVFGEWFDPAPEVTPRAARVAEVLAAADVQVEAVPDARARVWEKLMFLAPIAGFCAAARRPSGAIWGDEVARARFLDAVREVEAVSRALGVPVADEAVERIVAYMDALPPAMRPSMLQDLEAGRRIEVEALQGSVVRRGRAAGVPTPVMGTLYAILKVTA